jgi:ABC-type nitrate/sulfonate/bicarbonate transport system ATPase subunit
MQNEPYLLELQDVCLAFRRKEGGVLPVLDRVSLAARRGEFVALVGPSGCGKSTLFNAVTGLVTPDAGEIRRADGARVAYMPQRDLLLPWRTVLGNALLGPDLQGQDLAPARKAAQRLLPLFGLEGFASAYPRELSGGMRQRAALLRTALLDREIMLLDEPFGALDALTRAEMQEWLLGVWQNLSRTILFTTHDIDEALFLADRVYVLSARPARVVLELPVELPRPRPRSIVLTREFNALKSALWEALHPQASAL